MSEPKYWSGRVREHDDFGVPIENIFYDARTFLGPWATMAPSSFELHRLTLNEISSLGTGKGQRYELQPDGRWMKTAG